MCEGVDNRQRMDEMEMAAMNAKNSLSHGRRRIQFWSRSRRLVVVVGDGEVAFEKELS